ncbi:hypothetical protein Vretimale_12458 [Volvox reticuliferus]|uniref:Uncharacterized protein n=1 Tax=Volvox reticuliferus TaxID=1737510 RepID=A0A8J4CC30_9CHLO|nr:hypothetical protein Vretifemale_9120 [Volvox reticuliferus]GIM08451.1 hypothetical protein Vretimale_12458 [Volvox reticuliferus]
MMLLLALSDARIADDVAGRYYPAASCCSLTHIADVYDEMCISKLITNGAEGCSLLGSGPGAVAPPRTSAKSCEGRCSSIGLPKRLDTQPTLGPQWAAPQSSTSATIHTGIKHDSNALSYPEAFNTMGGCWPSPGPHVHDVTLEQVAPLSQTRNACSAQHDQTDSLSCGPRTRSYGDPHQESGCCREQRLGPETQPTQQEAQWRTKRLACGSQLAYVATAKSSIGPDIWGKVAAKTVQAATWRMICLGDSSCRCKGEPCGGGIALRQRQPLSLPLLLVMILAVLQGLMAPRPCAAASWPWVWGKSKAASAAVGSATPSPSHGWQFGGLLPYGWRKHDDAAAFSGDNLHSSRARSSGTTSGRTDSKAGSGKSRTRIRSGSWKSSSSKAQLAGQKAAFEQVTSHEYATSDSSGVAFRAGNVPVLVNPAGNVTELLEYDPLHRPPPPPPPPEGAKRLKTPSPQIDDDEGPRDLSDAQLALRELLLSNRLPYNPMEPYKLPAKVYVSSDFVFATGSFPARYILAQSTRSWRRDIRAFIAVNNTDDLPLLNEKNKVHQEHYEYFPDDGTGDLGKTFHGYMAGDTRAAMAPFLAHQYFGESYKWMLYGDDDTLFYMPAVKRLLAHLDPELPIAISDNLWFRARHPNLFAPRCLPCHLAVDADPQTLMEPPHKGSSNPEAPQPKTLHIPNVTVVMNGYLQFMLGVRSPADMESAKVQKLLTKNTFGDFNKSLAAISHLPPNASVPGVRYLPRPACPFCTARAACTPRPPRDHNVTGAGCFASGGHGGAGMIFSVGLLRRLAPERMKQCYMKIILAPGGDGMLSSCLWEAGYAFTDPGASTLARYDGNYLLFSSEAGKWMLHDPLTVLLRGKCDGRCKWLLRNAASHHGRGRHFQNFEQSAAYLYANVASYTATHKWLAFMAGRDEDLAKLHKLMTTGDSS